MQIPPLKKSTFWIIIAVVVLVGIFIGLMISSYVLLKNKVAFCHALNTPIALNLPDGQSVSGTVLSVSGNQIILQARGYDEFNTQTPTTINTSVSVGPNDTIVLPEFMSDSSTTSLTTSTISSIKAGDVITVRGLANDAKIIYLPIVNK